MPFLDSIPWAMLAWSVAKAVFVIFCVVLPMVSYTVYAERRVSAAIQDRVGPNRTGFPTTLLGFKKDLQLFLGGLGQPIADAVKFILKEDFTPGGVKKFYFWLAPCLAMLPLVSLAFVPFGSTLFGEKMVIADINVSVLGVFAVTGVGVYAIVIAGWASNSKYPFLGSVRASAQLISYELSMTLAVLPVFLWVNAPGLPGTMSFGRVVEFQSQPGFLGGMWFGFMMPLSAFIFLVALFAETNRQPFDTVESESDLVGSFHTEYGAFKWGLFFVAEYSHMIVGSGVFMLLFGGGWNPLPWVSLATAVDWLGAILPFAHAPLFVGVLSIAIFLGKTLAMIFLFMWVRWTLPRFRYDQVMKIGWQKMLPLSIANLLFYAIAIAVIQK